MAAGAATSAMAPVMDTKKINSGARVVKLEKFEPYDTDATVKGGVSCVGHSRR